MGAFIFRSLREHRVLIPYLLLHGLIFVVVFQGAPYEMLFAHDLNINYLYSSMIMDGQIPYLDFEVEYPPLALLFMTLPGLLASSQAGYEILFTLEMLILDLAGMLIIYSLSKRLELPVTKVLAVSTVSLLAVGPLIALRYDLAPAIMVLASVFFFTRGNYKTAWALLALGVMTKLYPIVLAPVFLLFHWRHHSKRRLLAGAGVFAATIAIVSIAPVIISPEGFWQSFAYHSQRPLQIESTYSSFLLLGQVFGITSLETDFSFGSTNIISPAADFFAGSYIWFTLIALAAVYWLFHKAGGRPPGPETGPDSDVAQANRLFTFSLLAILVFIVANKVLSPQFLIWLYPLVALANGRWRNAPWLMFVTIGLVTFFIYPVYYGGLTDIRAPAVIILFLRNMSLIALAILLAAGIKGGWKYLFGRRADKVLETG